MSVAGTYAEALFESAEDQGAVDRVGTELREILGAMEAVPQLQDLFTNPEIDSGKKKEAMAALLGDAHPVTRNFLQVVIDRGRTHALGEIVDAYDQRVASAAGRVELHVITAVPMPTDLRDRLLERVKAETGLDVVLTEEVDPEIVGGLVLRTDDAVLDASITQRLGEMRRTLTASPVQVGLES